MEDYYEAYTLLGKLFKESRHTVSHRMRTDSQFETIASYKSIFNLFLSLVETQVA